MINSTLMKKKEWLQSQRFHQLTPLFTNYSSNDLLRLSKSDMINLCGAPDGIRLFNTVHNILLKPRLNVYVTLDQRYFNAIYLFGDEKVRTLVHNLMRLYSNASRKTSTSSPVNSVVAGSTSSKDHETSSVEVKVEYAAAAQATPTEQDYSSINLDEINIFMKVRNYFR